MEPSYTTRERVKHALDVRETALADDDIDAAVQAGSRAVEGLLKRYFVPTLATRYEDYPERGAGNTYSTIYLTRELAGTPTAITAGGTAVTDALPRPDDGPPYDRIELNTGAWSTGTGLGLRAIALTGLWGFRDDSESAGATAEAVDTTETAIDVTDSASIGVGDLIKIDSERLTVADKALLDTGQNLGANLAATHTDDAVSVTSGAAFSRREIITIGTERMLITAIAGNTLTVRRAWDGSRLAAHTMAADIYAPRTLTVHRAAAGTTASAHGSAASITRADYPSLVVELATAEAMVMLLNRNAGYARTSGSGESERETAGRQVEMLRRQAYAVLRRPRGVWAV